jgi:hypothetical protein
MQYKEILRQFAGDLEKLSPMKYDIATTMG